MLPIHSVLEPLKAALRDSNVAVLAAPPGAGKTTVVPLALLDQPWRGDGRVLVLEPRRLAARAAADRMAASLGEQAGGTVGYRTRLQSRIGPGTRIEVITEGVFTRMILDDPALDGVAAVLFDEFHERSLDADLGLALAREAQGLLREDLRLLVMSATLDIAGVSRLLANSSGEGAPVIEAEGRMFPVETRYLGRNAAERLEDAVARAVRQALADETGSILVFLPGQGEIHRVARALGDRLPANADVVPLYGGLDKGEQDRAIEPPAPGRRKIVLATSVAETSLTIQGVRVVIDGGLSRVPRFEPSSGLTRLATVKVSRSSAEQRRGRAGRVEPGVCYRLWDEEQTRGLVAHQRPEILEADLTAFALDLARWGARSPDGLALLDPPPAGAFAEARKVLQRLEALDADGALTDHGRRLTRIPLSPRLAHMVAVASDQDDALRGASIAAVLSEPLGGAGVDLSERLRGLDREIDRSPRARDAMKLADRWAKAAGAGKGGQADPGALLAEAFPERVARARGKPGEFLLASGRGAFLDPTDVLAREPWLAVAELGGGDARDRIRLAAPVNLSDLEHRLEVEDRLTREPSGRMVLKRIRRIGAIVVDEKIMGAPDRKAITAALKAEVEAEGLKAIRWGDRASALRARLTFLSALEDGWPDVSDAGLWAQRETWLWSLLDTVQSLGALADGPLADGLRALIPWDRQRALNDLAPERLETPLGSAAIDYAAEGGPRVDIRVQELFGVKTHPTVGRGVALTLALLSPARRPIQMTKDLPGFWAGSWKDVRADMRGRYPRHPWPEDPSVAEATNRVKPRGT